MMQLTCPNCGSKIASAHINIQQMVAVCPQCDMVFRFDLPAPKIKRRKVKPPKNLTLAETDYDLHLAFRTNFRLDKNENFTGIALFSVVFTFLSAIFISMASEIHPLIPLGFGLATLFGYYSLALTAYNKTHIDATDDTITVSRRPIPNPLTAPTTIDLAGVERIHYEETAISQKEGYDTPRYGVWALMEDRSRRLIVNDVTVDYAAFVAQCLNERLTLYANPDIDRLTDADGEVETVIMEDAAPQARANQG
ncbi:MAG: hypothetical protein H6672_22935 [Anaerolineaceae bacterium]|nr:hypothetical protein [Anaerolineaceae bacterium]